MRKHERRKIDSFELWCWRGVGPTESLVDGEHEWSEKERKTKTKMAGHTQGVFERSHHQQQETRDARDRAGWRGAATAVARAQGSDATRRHNFKVTLVSKPRL